MHAVAQQWQQQRPGQPRMPQASAASCTAIANLSCTQTLATPPAGRPAAPEGEAVVGAHNVHAVVGVLPQQGDGAGRRGWAGSRGGMVDAVECLPRCTTSRGSQVHAPRERTRPAPRGRRKCLHAWRLGRVRTCSRSSARMAASTAACFWKRFLLRMIFRATSAPVRWSLQRSTCAGVVGARAARGRGRCPRRAGGGRRVVGCSQQRDAASVRHSSDACLAEAAAAQHAHNLVAVADVVAHLR